MRLLSSMTVSAVGCWLNWVMAWILCSQSIMLVGFKASTAWMTLVSMPWSWYQTFRRSRMKVVTSCTTSWLVRLVW